MKVRVEALERTIDTLEKTLRSLPDMGKFAAPLEAVEKALAGKKDAKTWEQEQEKSFAKLRAEFHAEQAAMSRVEPRLKVIEQRIEVLKKHGSGTRRHLALARASGPAGQRRPPRCPSAALGDEAFDRLYAQGAALRDADVEALALGEAAARCAGLGPRHHDLVEPRGVARRTPLLP